MNTAFPDPQSEPPFRELSEDGLALARKYAVPGPRYTSYPTAPVFKEDFDTDAVDRWLAASRDNAHEPLSLYVHLPFCHDICYYCACNKVVTRQPGSARAYLDRLEKEIHLQSERVGGRRPITQMHWGGGTPTYLDNAELTELMHMLASHFHLLDAGHREYSIEIDPRTVHTETVALLKGLGFNRISLGIQDFDPLVQKAINRIQPFSAVAELTNSIRALGFTSLSFDLIYGLPHQDEQSMTQNLAKVLELEPDRIACYNYAHLPDRFPSQRSIARLALPAPEEKLRLHALIAGTLREAGYIHIGMDHYARPGDDLALAQAEGRLQRNFQGYSLQMAKDLLGLGVSAISELGDFYLQNERDLSQYYERIDREEDAICRGLQVTEDDRQRRYLIQRLTCDLRVDATAFKRRFADDFHDRFGRELERLEVFRADGLVRMGHNAIEVTDLGRNFLRNICMVFDNYLPIQAEQRFSATV